LGPILRRCCHLAKQFSGDLRTAGGDRCRLCDDVGQQLAFDLRDLVLEQQLAFLEALHLQLIEWTVLDDSRDHVVEVAVLGPESGEFGFEGFDVEIHRAGAVRRVKVGAVAVAFYYSMNCADVMDRNTLVRNQPPTAPNLASKRAESKGAAFWRFSLALYARPGVADALIALQDRAGLDVNLILFGLWVGMRHARELGRDGFAAAAEAAAALNSVVRDIRMLRRQLGDGGDGGGGDIRRLRGMVLRLELAAERQVQRRLADCAAIATAPRASGDRGSAALANLAHCLGNESASAEAATLRRQLVALTRRA
jgi:uncharacterized protein (TIGR02444 family)